jgi:hypothetical protein
MGEPWAASGPGVIALPSGRLIRGIGLRGPDLPGPDPEFGLYLLRSEPRGVPWEYRWVNWPDYQLPADQDTTREAFAEAWQRSAAERVEVGCMGGLGRTGTALACIAVLDGVPPGAAVEYVRRHYLPQAVETADQEGFVAGFGPGSPSPELSTGRVDNRVRNAGVTCA